MTRRDIPLDVRLMDFTSRALLWLFACGALFVAGNWVISRPMWAIREVRVQGSLQHISASALRTQALPHLRGNWFTVDLAHAQQAFARVPWVHVAVVQRVWPLSLLVTLQAQQPAAVWGSGADAQLVNTAGSLFDANLGEVQGTWLPRLDGPPGSSAQVLAMLHQVDAALAPLHWRAAALDLGPEGEWRVQVDGGPRLELGRAADATAFAARLQRFVALVAEVQQRYGRPIVSADLRYANGFAVQLQGDEAAAKTAGADAHKGGHGPRRQRQQRTGATGAR